MSPTNPIAFTQSALWGGTREKTPTGRWCAGPRPACLYTNMYVCMYVYTCVCVCVCAYIYVCMHIMLYIYICAYMCVCILCYIYICIYIHTHTHTQICISSCINITKHMVLYGWSGVPRLLELALVKDSCCHGHDRHGIGLVVVALKLVLPHI